MNEEFNLVRDLAVILISAGVFTIISKALKQPLVLGYILAGFLIGPHVKFFFNISSEQAVAQWSEIGIIFMMFGLGLEFSFKKLLKVGSGALVTAGAKFLGVFVLGFVTGQALSWTIMESIFLGGLLSMSSTAVVLKSYEDMGLKDRPYAPLVFGTLVVEDLIAILLMVLLSTMAVSNQFAGGEMLFNLGKLAFFLILWFLVGLYLIPIVLKKTKQFINDEILLIVCIGLCFGMVTFASAIGFSSALGAFVMGSILAETIESEHIQSLVHPIKDLFGAVFFVSVGMMIAPDVILANLGKILTITILVYFTHIVFSAIGIVITGNGLKNGVYTGFSLAQLGEFGFIIAGVGVTLGVMRDFIYPVIIAVSVLTTFTTPYMIRLAGPVHKLILEKTPPQWLAKIGQLEMSSRRSEEEVSEWKKLFKAFFLRVVLYGVILLAIIIASRIYLDPMINSLFDSWKPFYRSLTYVSVTILVMSPFLYGMAVSTGSINTHGSKLLQEKESNRWPLLALILVRIFLAIGIVLAVISSHFHLAGWTIVMMVIGGVFLFLFARHGMHKYPMLEKQFLANLNEKETERRRRTPVTSSIMDKMAGYDVHIEAMDISPDSVFVGRKIKEIPFRKESGANIIKIQRGSSNIIIPSGEDFIYPYDHILAVGSTDQIRKLREMVKVSTPERSAEAADSKFEVVPLVLEADSYLTGKMLSKTNMKKYGCMIISVLRGNSFVTNPRHDLVFEDGDTVWVAGDLDYWRKNRDKENQ